MTQKTYITAKQLLDEFQNLPAHLQAFILAGADHLIKRLVEAGAMPPPPTGIPWLAPLANYIFNAQNYADVWNEAVDAIPDGDLCSIEEQKDNLKRAWTLALSVLKEEHLTDTPGTFIQPGTESVN